MSEYLCLSCGRKFMSRKTEGALSKPRQCGKCWSWFVVPIEEYERCKAQAEYLIKNTTFGIIPLWDVARAIFNKRGIRLTPRFTLMLCDRIYQDVIKEKRVI